MGPEGGISVAAAAPEPVATETNIQPPRREIAITTAEQVITNRIVKLRKDYAIPDDGRSTEAVDTKSMSPAEQDLYAIDAVAHGFSDTDYDSYPDGIPLNNGGGLTVTTVDGEAVKAVAIKHDAMKTDDDGNFRREYTCTTESDDPLNAGEKIRRTVTVTADALIAAHLAQKADAIAEVFESPDQKQLFTWYATERDTDPSDTIMEAVQTENKQEAMNKTNTFLEQQLARLREAIGQLTDAAAKAASEALLVRLQFGLKANGRELGAMAKMGALEQLALEGNLTTEEGSQLAEVMDSLEPQADEARDSLRSRLEDAGFAPNEIERLLETNLQELIRNDELMEKFNNIDGIDEALLGRSVSEDEIDQLAEQHLTPEQQSRAKKYGKGFLIALLISLGAVPAAAILGAAGVAAVASGMAGAAARQQ